MLVEDFIMLYTDTVQELANSRIKCFFEANNIDYIQVTGNSIAVAYSPEEWTNLFKNPTFSEKLVNYRISRRVFNNLAFEKIVARQFVVGLRTIDIVMDDEEDSLEIQEFVEGRQTIDDIRDLFSWVSDERYNNSNINCIVFKDKSSGKIELFRSGKIRFEVVSNVEQVLLFLQTGRSYCEN
ncbi:hypothetical protein [Levilactobacillus tujiorum]|uniref:hypothetical protein n=1 Tax=Levilactobacillus tujiorum TaxID=2912243 RepID=UPI00145703CB|nr:hypothetical protein [Levilactobacillus tujiorum]NLR31511.1 hypothetical protein [Levilactobacillus tujiorum]